MAWVASGHISSGDALSATKLPNDVTILPESAIRKYRAPYGGQRSSERINLAMQQMIGDLAFCLSTLTTAETNMEDLPSITVTTYCDKE